MKVGYEHDVDWVTARPLAEMQTQRLTLADGTLSLIEDEPPEVSRPEELKTNSTLLPVEVVDSTEGEPIC